MSSSDPKSFNLNDQPAVVSLLSLVRSSTLDLDDKNLIRDLVLDYVRTKDKSVVDQLTVYLAAINVVATTEASGETGSEPDTVPNQDTDTTDSPTPVEQPVDIPADLSFSPKSIGIGSRRPKPTFVVPDTIAKPTTPEVPKNTSVEDVKESIPAAQPSKNEEVADVSTALTKSPEPATASATSTPESASETARVEPQTSATSEDVVSQPTSAPPATKPAASTVATASETQAVSGGDIDHLRRIKEIKHAVNAKIGNPVHLVEADNTIGREYMNALLQAMKMVSMDSPVDAQLAMDRLEASFQKVETLLAQSDTDTAPTQTSHDTPAPEVPANLPVSKPPTTPAPTLTPDTADQEIATKKSDTASPVTKAPAVESASEDTENSSNDDEEQAAEEVAESPLAAAYQAAKEKESEPAKEEAAAEPKKPDTESSVRKLVPNQPPTPAAKKPAVPESDLSDSKSQQTPTQPAPRPQPTQPPVPEPVPKAQPAPQPVPEEVAQPLETNSLQAQLQDQMEKNKQAVDESINTPEVTSGLEQLLSEWEIFRRSGIFGTGPSGIDHPLYKTLKDLTMTTVIAGRFDGVNSVIRQSLADYMQGWHNEQAVTYQHSETFERYLRRVIRRILDDYKRTH